MKDLETPGSFHFLAAQGWLELGNSAEAQAELDQLDAAWQSRPEVLKLWIDAFVDQKNWEEALEKSAALIQAAPDDPMGWFHRSYCLHELKRTEEARDNLLRVIDKFPASGTMRYNLACYECQLGRLEQARHWLRKTYELGGEEQLRDNALKDPDLKPLWAEIREGRL